jgi:F-type H+-transporting ATPase subunit delta
MRINKRAKRQAAELFRSCRANTRLDENRVRHVMHQLLAAGRRECPAVLSHFRRLVKLDLARHTAIVDSATPLPEDVRAAIEAGLRRRYGPGLIAAFGHRPELIGGVSVQVGSDMYDGSVRAGLAALEDAFTRSPW